MTSYINSVLSELQTQGCTSPLNHSLLTPETIAASSSLSYSLVQRSNRYQQSLTHDEGIVFVPPTFGLRTHSIPTSQPFVYRRGAHGRDHGFIDIVNFDILVPSVKNEVESSPLFDELSLRYSINPSLTNYHIYYTKACTTTRSWHVDGPHRKIFIYLTDVTDNSGPYSYQPTTHLAYNKFIASTCVNQTVKNAKSLYTDAFTSPDSFVKYLGPAGTSFISDQRGLHRGQPQSPGHHRLVLVVQLF